ncbi:MAG: ABC transporter substrate-binding protein [Planctomycetaceae bacterium]|nr:ABC transporter substrate-binding protein [Planctomycetaceae bacterium]
MTKNTVVLAVFFTLLLAVQGFSQTDDTGEVIDDTPLFLQAPRYRLTLTSHYNGASFLVEPIEFPNGVRPNPLPRIDGITVVFFNNPHKKYDVKWNFIEKIDLFHELVFEEFQKLLKQTAEYADETEEEISMSSRFELLFDYLNFLNEYKKDLPAFNKEYKTFLLLEAQWQLKTGSNDAALVRFAKLLEENRRDNDLKSAAAAALDSVLTKEYAAERFTQCRTYFSLFAETLPQETLFLQWKEKIVQAALGQTALSKAALSKKQYTAAHLYNQTALSIAPQSAAVQDWQKELQQKAPLFRVAVSVPMPEKNTFSALPDAALMRYRRLLDNMFLQFIKPSLEGGVYRNDKVKVQRAENGLSLSFTTDDSVLLNEVADTISQLYKSSVNTSGTNSETLFARLFDSAHIKSAQIETAQQTAADTVTVKFKRRFPLPEALFAVPLFTENKNTENKINAGLYSLVKREENNTYFDANRYAGTSPAVINERLILRSEDAVTALKEGSVDIIDRVAPWETENLKKQTGIETGRYAVPEVHFIVPNLRKTLTSDRTFRRALSFGLNRQAMLGRILNKSPAKISERITSEIVGAVSSVPFIRGNSLGDPLGYANDTSIRPRQYEPKLAAALALSAFNQIRNTEKDGDKLTSIPILVLSYPANDTAKYAALLIKHQWAAIGVPVRIAERTDESGIGRDSEVDFWLVERTVKEPLTEAELIFGSGGLCDYVSPAMELALEKLRSVEDWSEAAKTLFAIHKICYEETTVIPLWQIYIYYAYRSEIKGIAADASFEIGGIVDLYENVGSFIR